MPEEQRAFEWYMGKLLDDPTHVKDHEKRALSVTRELTSRRGELIENIIEGKIRYGMLGYVAEILNQRSDLDRPTKVRYLAAAYEELGTIYERRARNSETAVRVGDRREVNAITQMRESATMYGQIAAQIRSDVPVSLPVGIENR